MEIFDLKDKLEYVNEVMELELLEWGDNPNYEITLKLIDKKIVTLYTFTR